MTAALNGVSPRDELRFPNPGDKATSEHCAICWEDFGSEDENTTVTTEVDLYLKLHRIANELIPVSDQNHRIRKNTELPQRVVCHTGLGDGKAVHKYHLGCLLQPLQNDTTTKCLKCPECRVEIKGVSRPVHEVLKPTFDPNKPINWDRWIIGGLCTLFLCAAIPLIDLYTYRVYQDAVCHDLIDKYLAVSGLKGSMQGYKFYNRANPFCNKIGDNTAALHFVALSKYYDNVIIPMLFSMLYKVYHEENPSIFRSVAIAGSIGLTSQIFSLIFGIWINLASEQQYN